MSMIVDPALLPEPTAAVLAAANAPLGVANIADQDSQHDTRVMTAALVAARTGNSALREKAIGGLLAAVGTEPGARALALGRNIPGYVIAADALDYHNPVFESWVRSLLTYPTTSGPTSLIECARVRPNNWGTHALAAWIATYRYLGEPLDGPATVFHGWLGNRGVYSGFKFGALDWQSNWTSPVAINPVGATIQGYNVDGALPEEMRRAGSFKHPPPRENYCWEALQGAALSGLLLHGAGYPAFEWENQALRRAADYLYEQADFPPEGDDRNVPHVLNVGYPGRFALPSVTTPSKNMAHMEWATGAFVVGATPVPDPPPPTDPEPEPPVPPVDCHEVEAELAQARADVLALTGQVHVLTAEVAALTTDLTAARDQAARLTDDLAEEHVAHNLLRNRVDRFRDALHDLTT